MNINPKIINVLAKQQNELVTKPPDGKLQSLYQMLISIGVLFYPNQEGDVVDIQADILGPGKLHQTISSF
jgi:hypothetical protein